MTSGAFPEVFRLADYSSAASSAATALSNAVDGGLVEEYQHGQIRVRRGSVKSQIAAAALLEGLAARRANGGLLHLAKHQEATDA